MNLAKQISKEKYFKKLLKQIKKIQQRVSQKNPYTNKSIERNME